MKKFYFLWSFIAMAAIFCSQGATAQQAGNVRGTVSDETGQPVAGASIMIEGTYMGTVTDREGKFSLNAPSDAVLEISSLGHNPERIEVNGRMNIAVVLTEDSRTMDEVVVVGFGTQKKINLTGAVESVSGDELVKRPVMNTTQALQGMAAGVTITSTSGQPGNEGESIRIRGIGTLNNSNPLVLVDGVENTINAVNAQDIESISILKDAASAAIYGSRAANGVILITTKRAKSGKFSVSINSSVGIQSLIEQPKFLGSIEYMELYDAALSNDTRNMQTGAAGGVMYGADYIANYKSKMALDPYNYPDTDWQKVTYKQPAIQHMHNVTMSGGTEKLRSLASINYTDQEGVFPGTYQRRYTLRSNTDYQFNDKFSVGVDVSGRKSETSSPGTSATVAMGAVRRTAPIYPYITPGGNPAYVQIGANTWAMSQEKYAGYNRWEYQEVLATLKANYRPIEQVMLDFSYSPKLNNNTNKVFNNVIPYHDVDDNPVNVVQNRALVMNKESQFNDDLKFLATYDDSFGKHNIHVLGGFQQITFNNETLRGRREGSEFQYDELDAFPVLNQSTGGGAGEWALQSVFGRINYDFAGKYLFEANVRYDGSSRFAKGNRWGVFPSFSAGWRLSEEEFMKSLGWLSNAKFRASWGQLGNQNVGSNYPFSMDIALNETMVFNNEVVDGYAAKNYAFRNISWETTTMTNIGVDLGFLLNRLNVTFDYYVKTTDDILLGLDIPSIMGYNNSPIRNAGKVENKGWDFSVAWNDSHGDFSYRVAANLSDVKNKIIDMKDVVNNFDDIYTNRAGYAINSIWGLQADGLFPSFEAAQAWQVVQYGQLQGGDIRYKDQLTVDTNGDGVFDAGDGEITSDDYIVIGSTIPRYTFSLDFSARYKGFDLGIFLQGVGKRDGYLREDLAWAFNNGAKVQAWQRDGAWQEGQENAKYPRLFIASDNNIKTSTYWLQNAAYLRLKNVQLGYTLPRRLLDKTFLETVRVYVSGQNLLTFHKMTKGYDPEQDPAKAQNSIPLLRTFSFGINLNF